MFHAKFIQTFVCLAMLSVFGICNYSTFGKHYISFRLDFMVTPYSVTMATDRVSKINKAKISLRLVFTGEENTFSSDEKTFYEHREPVLAESHVHSALSCISI